MERFDDISREIPVLANVRPSGKYLMEDFYYAGGILGLMAELRDRLDLTCRTVTGQPLADGLDGAKVHLRDIIHSLDDPVSTAGATAVLTGNLAPRGCVMKPSAADPRLLKHRGPALVFEDYNHMAARDRPRRSRRHAGPYFGAQKFRPQGRPRHAGMGHAADPEEAPRGRACATCCASPTRA